MTTRKPIVLVGNNTTDLPPGDDVGDLAYWQSQGLTAAQKAQAAANMGFLFSNAATGYIRFPPDPSGKSTILQWGTNTSGGDNNNALPVTFPNAIETLDWNGGSVSGNNAGTVMVDSLTTSSIATRARYINNGGGVGSATQPVHWLCWGF